MGGDHLGHSKHTNDRDFCSRGSKEGKKQGWDFWRIDICLSGTLAKTVTWEAVWKGKGVPEGWACFQKEILNMKEQAIPMCRKQTDREDQSGRIEVKLSSLEIFLKYVDVIFEDI